MDEWVDELLRTVPALHPFTAFAEEIGVML
jgi:hypothetical protein